MHKIFKKRHEQIWYIIGGGTATLFDILLLCLFHTGLDINMYISAILAFCITVVYGYFFHRYITFSHTTKKNHITQFGQFLTVNGFTQILYMVLLYILTTYTRIYYIIIAIFSKGFIFILNYLINKYITFKQAKYTWYITIVLAILACIGGIRYIIIKL